MSRRQPQQLRSVGRSPHQTAKFGRLVAEREGETGASDGIIPVWQANSTAKNEHHAHATRFA
jgi:hypothetical protein